MDTPPVIPDLVLLRRIGGGSYGDVWLARTITGVYRAVKIVDKARFADERPFLRELDGISRFQRSVGDQPRQLALMHVGRLDERGIFYYTMELADDVEAGTDIDPDKYQPLTLKALYERRPDLPAAEVVRIGVELARSLEGLHGAGLIHRDVKPSNIIFVAGVPKLADIGLVSSSDHTLTSLGTPGYSPPEGAGTTRADIYSLGKILYQLATGQHPDEFPRLPRDAATREDARALFELNEIVLKACQPDPGERHATARAMLDELLLLQAGRSVKELNAMRERLRLLGRTALWLGAGAAVVIAVLGVKNYFAARELAAQEQRARIQAEEDERLARYTANLHVAQLAYNSGDSGLARAALRREIPEPGQLDLRGLEWRALWNETAGDQSRVFGEIGGAINYRLEISPRADQAVTVSGPTRQVSAWDLTTGARRELMVGVDRIGGFSADGSQVLVRTIADGAIRMLDVASGQLGPVQLTDVTLHSYVKDGRRVLLGRATPAGVRLSLWDFVAQQETAVLEPDPEFSGQELRYASVSPDARWLYLEWSRSVGASSQFESILWNLAAGRVQWRAGDVGDVTSMAFSPDSGRVALATFIGSVILLSVDDVEQRQVLHGQAGFVRDLEFSPDGGRLYAAGGDQVIRAWDVRSGEVLEALRGHEGPVNVVLHRSAHGTLLSAGDDGTLREWHIPPRRPVVSRGGFWTQLLGQPVVAPDGSFIAATLENGRLARVDPEMLLPAEEPWDAGFVALGFAAEGLRALGSERELVIINPESGAVQETGLRLEGTASLEVLEASEDGGIVIMGMADGTVTLWDCAARRVIQRETVHRSSVQTVAVSRDGAWAASGDRTGRVLLWRPGQTGEPRELSGEESMAFALAFSSTGRWLAVFREDGSLTAVDTASMATVVRQPAHTNGANVAVFTPDDSRLISAGFDGLILVWAVRDFRPLGALSFEPGVAISNRTVCGLALSKDQRLLVAFTNDGRLRRWSLQQ